MRAAPVNKLDLASVYARWTALLICLFILLLACTAIPVTRPVIKLGLAAPFQGEYRYVGYDAIFAARLALREVNAAGGVAGYSVELVAYDDEGTVAGARRVAQNLVLDPDVVAVIGHFREKTTATAQQVYNQAGLSLITAGTVEGGSSVQMPEHLYCSLLHHLDQAIKAGGLFTGDKVQWIPGNLLSTRDIERLVQTCGSVTPVEIDAQLPPPPGTLAVILPTDPVVAGETAHALLRTGWVGFLAGGPGLGSPLFSQLAGPAEVVFASPFRWPDVSGQDAEFRAAYRSLGPHVPEPGPFALSTYYAFQSALKTVATVGQGSAVDRSSFTQALSDSSSDMVFIYRRTTEGELELISQRAVPRSNLGKAGE